MLLEVRATAPFFKNGYVLGCEATSEAVIIDPGDEVGDLLDVVTSHHLAVKYILLTHAHVDHITGVQRAKDASGAPIGLHREDVFLYQNAPEIGRMFGVRMAPAPPIDFYYEPRQRLAFGGYDVTVHHTPGHCPGGVCLQVGPHGTEGRLLFVGDTLFAGSIGRTDLPGGDHATLIASIERVLFAFGDDAVVYSGHGPATTIGQERRTNPFLT